MRVLQLGAGMVVLATSACVIPVTATGTVQATPEAVLLVSSNGKSRPIAAEGPGAEVCRVPGAIVSVDGVLRRGAIAVEAWHPIEGPLGFTAWTGLVTSSPTGLVLRERDGGTLGLGASSVGPLDDAIGHRVLVEGIVNGTMSIDVLAIHRLDADPGAP